MSITITGVVTAGGKSIMSPPPPPGNGDIGVFFGGDNPWVGGKKDIIDYIQISVGGTATDFGNLTTTRMFLYSVSNGATGRGVIGGGTSAAELYETSLDYVGIGSPAHAVAYGDLSVARRRGAAASNATDDKGIFMGGGTNTVLNIIDWITISGSGTATDFGDMTVDTYLSAATSNGTGDRAINGGGNIAGPGLTNIITYVNVSSDGDAANHGELDTARQELTAASNATNDRAVYAGGYTGVMVNVIDYVTISTGGTASPFGGLNAALVWASGVSDGVGERAVFAGGYDGEGSSGLYTAIDYITISAGTGDATNFGDLLEERYTHGGVSDGAT